jgi:hypothetical protein
VKNEANESMAEKAIGPIEGTEPVEDQDEHTLTKFYERQNQGSHYCFA